MKLFKPFYFVFLFVFFLGISCSKQEPAEKFIDEKPYQIGKWNSSDQKHLNKWLTNIINESGRNKKRFASRYSGI